MVLDFSKTFENIQNDKAKKAIICQCALESFIAVTQEINSILLILKNENVTPNEFIEYVENSTDQITPYLLKSLTGVHGKNLTSVSRQLSKDLAKQSQLTLEELKELSKKEKEIGAEYFMECDPLITQRMNKYMVELLKMDSI